MQDVKTHVDEGREWFAKELASRERIPLMRNGEIVGYTYPPNGDPAARKQAIHEAGEKLDQQMAELGLTEDELMAAVDEFYREEKRRRRNGP